MSLDNFYGNSEVVEEIVENEKLKTVQNRQDWLYDAILQFLKSPIWNNPINTFIDEMCIIFTGGEENKFSHSHTHNDFRKLIEGLLETHLKNMGITPEEFVECCAMGAKKDEFLKVVFDYILAMDDFLAFKKMMEARNKHLELESLEALKRMNDNIKEGSEDIKDDEKTEIPQKKAEVNNAEDVKKTEEEMMKEVIAKSIEENDLLKKQHEKEEAELKHAIALSLALQNEMYEKVRSEAEKKKKDEKEILKKELLKEDDVKEKDVQNVDDKKKNQIIDEVLKEKDESVEIVKRMRTSEDAKWKELEREKFQKLKEQVKKEKEESTNSYGKVSKSIFSGKVKMTESEINEMKVKLMKQKRAQLLKMRQKEREEKMDEYLKKKKKKVEIVSKDVKKEVKKEEEVDPKEEHRKEMMDALQKMVKKGMKKKSSISEMKRKLKDVEKRRKKKKKDKVKSSVERKKKMGSLFDKITVKDD